MEVSVLVRKSVLNDIGGFDENKDLISVEDYDLWIRISLRYKIKFLNHHLIRYRIHSANFSGILQTGINLFRYKQFKIIYQKHESIHSKLVREVLYNYLHRLRLQNQILFLSRNKKFIFTFLRNDAYTVQQRIWVIFRIIRDVKFIEKFFTQFKGRMNSYNVGRFIVRNLAKMIYKGNWK